MQIFYVEYDDQAEARATSSSRLDNSHWISFFYPASRHRCSIAEKSMDGFPKFSIEQSCKWDAMVTMKRARVLHRKALKPEDADILCGVWWPSWSTCNKQQPTWQFPLNKFFYPSGGTKFMLLDSLTKHPSRSTADHISKSISCGRCGTVNYHPLLNL